ncbi:hypothetical protein CGU37_13070 [Pseudomonas fluorescens]|nr:hypothetical protein CGU36_14025 [Pseudomonas fluorescens]OZO48728.1 hypothetical protein CGU37_13070 [Pseudomonas fluorescens]
MSACFVFVATDLIVFTELGSIGSIPVSSPLLGYKKLDIFCQARVRTSEVGLTALFDDERIRVEIDFAL